MYMLTKGVVLYQCKSVEGSSFKLK